MHITTFLAVLKTWNFSGKSGKNFGHGTDLEKSRWKKTVDETGICKMLSKVITVHNV